MDENLRILREPPVRLCCGERHYGAVCPDGLVMCCICFFRFKIEDLSVQDGTPVDVCKKCHEVTEKIIKLKVE